MKLIGNKWDDVLREEYSKEYFVKLNEWLDGEYETAVVYPPRNKIFAALQYVDFDNVKVVILGQDPYHGEGQANGMAFAVGDGTALPPSLVNIFKEIQTDTGTKPVGGGSLIGWAKQGVLLLNTVLTVRKNQAFSHADAGWQKYTDAIIYALNACSRPIVYILWGAGAIAKKPLIDPHHHIITSAHPSPLSAYKGFFGSRPFSKANNFLESQGQSPIDWSNISGIELADYYAHSRKISRVT